jgi:hypothetical protein
MRQPSWISLYIAGLAVVLAVWILATRVHGWLVIPLTLFMLAVLVAIRIDQFKRLDQHLPPWLRGRR